MPIIDSRSDSKFDALIRTNKADSLMSFIMASYNVKTNDNRKSEVAKRLKSAYELFKENVKGSTSGAGTYGQGNRDIIDQFESHYTMGYEMGIWQDSDFTLCPLAVKVAQYQITVKEYIGIVFTNLFAFYTKNGQATYHHFLYEILKEAKKVSDNVECITKDVIVDTLPIEKNVEQGNMIFNYLLATDFFEMKDKDTLKLNKKRVSSFDELISLCNLEYKDKTQEEAIEMAKDKKLYANYVTKSLLENSENAESIKEQTYSEIVNESERIVTGRNILLYGVPGSGKSWTIEHEYCDDEKCMERLVFHPDYMYSDFVGQILPVVKKDDEGTERVRYEFKPGPFTKILKKAYEDPSKSYYLVIEEINRGNAPAIFGEIFQLLDRMDEDKDGFKKGTSEYGITNENIALEVYGDPDIKVRIPANLSILGTMNTSDQNVFTLDTAFQRRWIMRMIKNSFVNHKYANNPILDTSVSWKQFCEAINEEILRRNNVTSSEDKRLGAYFVSADDLVYVKTQDGASEKQIIDAEHKNARFAEKVIKYLWDDAFKFSHPDTFDTRRYKSLEMVIDAFNTSTGDDRFKVYHENLRKLILEGIDENNSVSEEDNE